MTVRILNCDVMDGLHQLPDESVHCVCTSPPYWGLRDYGVDGQIGLEATPDLFVARMVEVFREVRRVLRKDGTCWLNLGDSYTTGGSTAAGSSDPKAVGDLSRTLARIGTPAGLKAKDLVGIPWRVAFALQADGWWLRSDVIWHKPNPMPESVTDRPTKAHEYVFLLTKSERYFYDAEAIKEATIQPLGNPKKTGQIKSEVFAHAGTLGSNQGLADRNKRSVWTVATTPYSAAHFATFPPELPEICIKAGTSQHGCCAKCGAQWSRWPRPDGQYGWQPTCRCYLRPDGSHACGDYEVRKHEAVPCTVLDPFSGAGTTCLVADRLQRHGIGIELNPEYAAMAQRRVDGDRGGLLDMMETENV